LLAPAASASGFAGHAFSYPSSFSPSTNSRAFKAWFYTLFWIGIGLTSLVVSAKLIQGEGALAFITSNVLDAFYSGAWLLFILPSSILWYVGLYRAWKVVQPLREELGISMPTPAKAVGFCFIPIFNLYWQFVAIPGLAKKINQLYELRTSNFYRVSVGLGIAIACLNCLLFVFIPLWLLFVSFLQAEPKYFVLGAHLYICVGCILAFLFFRQITYATNQLASEY